jgi:hypothetical protein
MKKIYKERIFMFFKYKMEKGLALSILKDAKKKGSPNNKDNQKYLCEYVNHNFGLLRPCSEIILY